MKSVLVTDGLENTGLFELRKHSSFKVIYREKTSKAELVDLAKSATALLIRTNTQLPAQVLEQLPELKLIVRAGVGLDHVDLEYCEKKGIQVYSTPGANADSAADLTLGLILALARKIPKADKMLKSNEWQREPLIGTELRGKTLGILGVGNVGSKVFDRALAFGMKVIAHDIAFTKYKTFDLEPHLEPLLRKSDFLTLHIPKDKKTTGLIGANELSKLKKGAFLINAARGGIVDEIALLKSLKEGHLAGAAADVFNEEPILFPSELVSHPNFIATPHIGGFTTNAHIRVSLEAAKHIVRYFNPAQIGPTAHEGVSS